MGAAASDPNETLPGSRASRIRTVTSPVVGDGERLTVDMFEELVGQEPRPVRVLAQTPLDAIVEADVEQQARDREDQLVVGCDGGHIVQQVHQPEVDPAQVQRPPRASLATATVRMTAGNLPLFMQDENGFRLMDDTQVDEDSDGLVGDRVAQIGPIA